MKKVSIVGLSPKKLGEGLDQSLVTHLMSIELPCFFDLTSNPFASEMEATFQAIHNRVNTSRVREICTSITDGLSGKDKMPVLSLTFVAGGVATAKHKRNGLVELSYSANNTLIVDGVLTLFAIMTLLGFEHPFEKKRKSSKQSIVDNSKLRQDLSNLPVQVTLIFNSISGIEHNQIISYYYLYSKKNSQLHAPLLNTLTAEEPIKNYTREIADTISLDEYGGMMSSSLRLSKSDQAITTESTMIRVILGAIAGASAQDKNKVSDFNSGTAAFTQEAKAKLKKLITLFFSEWLVGIKNQIENDRDGLHYSPSVWLALGLVIHDIVSAGSGEAEIKVAAKKLASLDYSNKASHWADSGVMELDITGNYYKNAAGGGRRFRVGLAKYFMNLIN